LVSKFVFRVLPSFPRFTLFPAFTLFSAFYPLFRVLPSFPRFTLFSGSAIPFRSVSAFYPTLKNSLSEILYVMLSRTSRTSGFATGKTPCSFLAKVHNQTKKKHVYLFGYYHA
jgi:hypothetical protein